MQTPTLDSLAAEGVLLMRHYVHYVCTPTRSAVQTGRLPVHVQLSLRNPDEPSSGIPRNMRYIRQADGPGDVRLTFHYCLMRMIVSSKYDLQLDYFMGA